MQTVLLNAVAATTTSTPVNIENLDDITLQFFAASISSGNGVFTVDGSNDGINWLTSIAFLDAVATAVGTFKASHTLSSNVSGAGYLKDCGFKMIRVVVTRTTDGSYSCILSANKKVR